MHKVLVLLGGNSDEREVSLRSGAAVMKALQASGYEVTSYDPVEGTDKLLELLATVDVVFPALHGTGGEDGTIQDFLESSHTPFVGSDSQSSKLCFNKQIYKEHLMLNGFPVADGVLVSKDTIWSQALVERPFVLKPHDGGSSIDTFIVRDPEHIDSEKIDQALERHPSMLLEELIVGTEMTVAVLGDQALPVIEIVPPADEEFDYENKYNGKTQELCPPVSISEEAQAAASELALSIHTSTGCSGMSRTDIMLQADGKMFVLETNTIPGLTDQSLLPKAAQAAGISMPELVDILVKNALTRA